MQKPSPSKNAGNAPKDPIHEKLTDFGNILQNFGLNLIQSIGEMKHTLSVLADKVDQIDKELINLKGLKTSLQDLDKFRRDVDGDFSEIKAQLNSLIGKMATEGNKISSNGEQDTQNLNTPLDVLNDFESKIANCDSSTDMRSIINTVKEKLFILTGGHKILFELRELELSN